MMPLENGKLKQILKNLDRKHFTLQPWNAFVNMNYKQRIIQDNLNIQTKLLRCINIMMLRQIKPKKKKYAKNITMTVKNLL